MFSFEIVWSTKALEKSEGLDQKISDGFSL